MNLLKPKIISRIESRTQLPGSSCWPYYWLAQDIYSFTYLDKEGEPQEWTFNIPLN